MDVQHGAVIEHCQLMLPPALDTRDRSAEESPETRFAEISADIRMEHFRAYDARARGGTSERTRSMLDFRELRHERQRIPATGHPQPRAIDSAARARRV
jgi:hypothetical protein